MNGEDSIIIGGGPIGLFLGSKLKGSTIIEQKKRIGTPVRCTGILTDEAQKIVPSKLLSRVTKHKLHKTTIIGPHAQASVELSTNYIIDNEAFEEQLADLAQRNKTEILTNNEYLSSPTQGHLIKDNNSGKKKLFKQSTIIGADGPQSRVNNVFGMNKTNNTYLGMQARLKVNEHDDEQIKFFPHIGKYAWYVPEGPRSARVGICAELHKEPRRTFETFLKRFAGQVINKQAGLIPLHNPHRRNSLQRGRLRATLVGDAAGHIKNTTGGGLIPGMKAAQHLAKTGKPTPASLRFELYNHFLVHNLLSCANAKEWDSLILAAKRQAPVYERINRDRLFMLLTRLFTNKTFLGYGAKKILSGKVRVI